MLVWLSVWSEVHSCIWPSWCHCHSLSLALVNSRLVLSFWYSLAWVVPEKGHYTCACVCVSFRTIYEKLAEAVSDEGKDLYQQRCSEISPNIRYCEYNIGDESAAEDLRQMRRQIGREDPLTARLDVRRTNRSFGMSFPGVFRKHMQFFLICTMHKHEICGRNTVPVQNCLKPTTPSRSTGVRTHG